MSKMGLHDPFGHFKHKLWPKEKSIINLAIWLPTTKSRKSPWFLCVQVLCDIPLESSWQGIQLCCRPHLDQRSTHKVMRPQIAKDPTSGISGLGFPLGSPRIKWHLGAGPMARHRVFYKGEGGGFPQVRAVVSLVSPSLPMVRPSTKSIQTMH